MIWDFFTAAPWYVLLFVFAAKALEVTLTTIRIILVNRGFKLPGAVLSFIEVLIWVFVASQVINDVNSAPLLGVVYALGYAVGVYIGTTVEKKLAFGKVMLNIIIPYDNAEKLMKCIRDKKIGLTTVNARGLESDKLVLLLYANRKNIDKLKLAILEVEPRALIAEKRCCYLIRWNCSKKRTYNKMMINKDLKGYIYENIISQYEKLDLAHKSEHA